MAEKKSNIIDVEDLLIVWKFLGKNWLILLLFPVFAAIAAYFYVHRMPDEYGAKTEILLGTESGYEYQSQIYRNLTGYGGGVNQLTNQIRVLKSHDLIANTLDKLDYQISYFIVGRVKTTEIPYIDAFSIDIKLIDGEGADLFGVPFDIKIVDENTFSLKFDNGLDAETRIHEFNTDIVTNEYVLRVDLNKLLSDDTFNKLKENDYQFIVNSKRHLIKKYKEALEIENEDGTSILEISVKDHLARKAKMFLDSLSASYIDYTIQAQIDLNENTLDYIDRQLAGITYILDSIETNLEGYKKNNDILDLSREQSEFFEKLLNFEAEKRELQLKNETLNSLETYLTEKTDERLLPPAMYIVNDDFLQTSLKELYNLEVQRSQASYDVKETSVGLERIAATIQSLRSNILVYISNLRSAMRDRAKDVNKEIAYYESLLRKLPQSQREMLNIQRNLDVNEKMYVYLLEKKANTIIARAAIVPEVSVIEIARNVGVVGPPKAKIIYYFIAVGLLLGLMVSFLRSVFFDRIQNTRELKQITELPIMGSIPESRETDDRLIVTKNFRSNIAESFRSIRANLQYFLDRSQSQIILFTSLHPGEGKTFCSVNTAAIIASAQKKVLLLDFDMHKPKVHLSLELNSDQRGLSTYISGRDSLQDVIMESGIENLDVIPAGPVPPNASELVLSEKVETMLDELRKHYQYIIIDTPPIMLISDSMVLMRLVNLGIFVMNTEKATKGGVNQLEEIVQSSNLEHTSIILNNVKSSKWKYYYGKYGYRYGYGYGYGYTSEYKNS